MSSPQLETGQKRQPIRDEIIVFDLDGTLHQTDLIALAAVNAAASSCGVPAPAERAIRAALGLPAADFCAELFPEANSETRQRLASEVRARERELIPRRAALFAGAAEMLHALASAGLGLAVCSNGSPEYIGSVLRATRTAGYFRLIEGYLSGRDKSQALACLLDRAQAADLLYVGDTVTDLQAARDNLVPCIAALYGYGADALANADFKAHSPAGIVPHVRRWRVFTLLERLIGEQQGNGPPIVGISGPDTAGKTRFALGLAAHLTARGSDVSVIHIDDFHNPREIRRQGPNEIEAYLENAFNLELLVRELLLPIRRHGVLERSLTLLDLQTDEFSNRRHFNVGPDSVVIVEGTLLFRPPVDELLQLRVVLEADEPVILRRAAARDANLLGADVVDRYKRKYLPIQGLYNKRYRPGKRADVVVDNNDFDAPTVIRPGEDHGAPAEQIQSPLGNG